MRILLTEDNIELADITALNLRKHGFAVDIAYSGEKARRLVEDNGPYDAIVLDLVLPDIEGTKLLEDLRAIAPKVPVLALTARDTEEDKIKGIQIGFDDYMTKPFSHHELVARLGVLFRSQHSQDAERIKIGPLQMSHGNQTTFINEVQVKLTLNEFRLLYYLATNKGRVVSMEELLALVWDSNATGTAKIITTVSRLRKKLGDYRKNIIRTCKGGYTVVETNV